MRVRVLLDMGAVVEVDHLEWKGVDRSEHPAAALNVAEDVLAALNSLLPTAEHPPDRPLVVARRLVAEAPLGIGGKIISMVEELPNIPPGAIS